VENGSLEDRIIDKAFKRGWTLTKYSIDIVAECVLEEDVVDNLIDTHLLQRIQDIESDTRPQDGPPEIDDIWE
jgi:hypothetical protein